MRKGSVAVAVALCAVAGVAEERVNLGKMEIVASEGQISRFEKTQLKSERMELLEKNTVEEALNTISGINVYGYGARGEKTVSVRGFSARHTPVFIDSIPVNVPYDGYLDLSNFTTFNIDEIQVSKGLSSVLLGTNTFAGAINFVTKRPTKKLEGKAQVGMFSGEGKKGYLNVGTNQGNYYVQGSASYYDRDYVPVSDDFKTNTLQPNKERVNSYKTDKNVNLKFGFTPNDTDEYAFNYINQTTEKGMPYPVYQSEINNNSYRQWPYSDKESFYFLSKTQFDMGYLKTRLFYDSFENNMYFFKDNTFRELRFDPTPYDADTKGISLEIGENNDKQNVIKLAINAKRDTQKDKDKSGDVTATMQIDYLSIGLEDSYKVNDSLKLIAGASYDKDDVKKAENGDYKATGTRPYENVEEFELTSESAFNPMIKIEYEPDESFGIYAGIAKKTRFASLKDRYSFRLGRAIPNPDLKPESTINYELGAEKTFDNETQGVKATLFYYDVTDYIQAENIVIGTKTYAQNQNIGEVVHKGYELEYFFNYDKMFDFDVSYTWLDAEDKKGDKDITDAPEHKIALNTTYKPTKALKTNLNMQYSSSRHTASDDRSKDVGSATIWNAKVGYEIVKDLVLDVGVNNLFDKNYQYSYGYLEAGRVVYSNLNYKF